MLLIIGFLIGGFGHLAGSNALVLVGIVIVFLATVLLPLLVYGNPY